MATLTSYQQKDIPLMQFSTLSNFTFTLKDSNNVPINLTGATVYFCLKKDIDAENANAEMFKVITLHSDPLNGTTTIEFTDGDWDFDLVADDNGNFTYWYAISFVLADGRRDTAFWGKATVIKCTVKN